MSNTLIPCSGCGAERPPETLIAFGRRQLCPECLEECTLICACCGERIHREDNFRTAAEPLCQNCYDSHYTNCENCGTLIRLEDARYGPDDQDGDEPYCTGCFPFAHHHGNINDYYYKPVPIFYGDGPRYFGVELEIDGAGEDGISAGRLLELANDGAQRVYCKHDGSLDEGFEIVTHPMTMDYHHKELPWRQVLEAAADMGYVSHKSDTCGLHVHVSRAALGVTEREQDTCIARILYFVEKHWEELLKFSRRTESQLRRWAARYGYKDRPMEILDHAKKGIGVGRYTSVNLENRDTIEFRIFRGTLKYNTLIATLQMVDRICDVALSLSDDQLKAMPWTTFVSGCREPELVQYLKERRLYVNDPVAMEVEL